MSRTPTYNLEHHDPSDVTQERLGALVENLLEIIDKETTTRKSRSDIDSKEMAHFNLVYQALLSISREINGTPEERESVKLTNKQLLSHLNDICDYQSILPAGTESEPTAYKNAFNEIAGARNTLAQVIKDNAEARHEAGKAAVRGAKRAEQAAEYKSPNYAQLHRQVVTATQNFLKSQGEDPSSAQAFLNHSGVAP